MKFLCVFMQKLTDLCLITHVKRKAARGKEKSRQSGGILGCEVYSSVLILYGSNLKISSFKRSLMSKNAC